MFLLISGHGIPPLIDGNCRMLDGTKQGSLSDIDHLAEILRWNACLGSAGHLPPPAAPSRRRLPGQSRRVHRQALVNVADGLRLSAGSPTTLIGRETGVCPRALQFRVKKI